MLCTITNFAAGTFKRDPQYLMPKNGLMCPDPNNSNDRRRLRTRLRALQCCQYHSHKFWLLAVRGTLTINMPLLKYRPCYRHLRQRGLNHEYSNPAPWRTPCKTFSRNHNKWFTGPRPTATWWRRRCDWPWQW